MALIKCPECGREISDKAGSCPNCGYPISAEPQMEYDSGEMNGIRCPKCGSGNVSVELIQKAGKTKKHGNGIGGHINNTARGLTAACTLGVSNLVWKKSTGNEKTKYRNETMCICQNCGKTWKSR